MKKYGIVIVMFLLLSFGFISEENVYARDFAKRGTVMLTKGNSTVLYSKWTRGHVKNTYPSYHIKSLKSSNKKVVNVNKYGVVKAKSVGSAKITLVGYKDMQHKYVKKHTWKIVVKKSINAKNKYKYKVETIDGEKGVTLLKYIGDDSQIKIPKKIDDLSVIKIADECFGGCDGEEAQDKYYIPQSVVMGNNIKYIGDYAFSGCVNLKKVVLSNKLLNIGKGLFAYSAINDLNINAIYRLNKVPDYTFVRTPLISNKHRRLVIPENVKAIGDWAYAFNTISEITLNEGLEEIGTSAFLSDYGIEADTYQRITIPSTVKKVGNSAFECDTLIMATIKSKSLELPNAVFKTKISITHSSLGEKIFK